MVQAPPSPLNVFSPFHSTLVWCGGVWGVAQGEKKQKAFGRKKNKIRKSRGEKKTRKNYSSHPIGGSRSINHIKKEGGVGCFFLGRHGESFWLIKNPPIWSVSPQHMGLGLGFLGKWHADKKRHTAQQTVWRDSHIIVVTLASMKLAPCLANQQLPNQSVRQSVGWSVNWLSAPSHGGGGVLRRSSSLWSPRRLA